MGSGKKKKNVSLALSYKTVSQGATNFFIIVLSKVSKINQVGINSVVCFFFFYNLQEKKIHGD